MATPNYDINYDDERFKAVETQKQAALDNVNNTYNNMINQSDKFYQNQIDATKDYANTQKELQQANTDFAIEKINQQKDQTRKDYLKEQTGAYVDWQRQSNQYGANAEQMAARGLTNTGYSESSQVSMYNTYQNRMSTARDSYNRAVLNYDNSIKEAMLANNSALAEIAYNALKNQLELSLQGFQYKNTLLETQLNQQRDIDKDYYSRWQNVLSQMNTENQLKENIRQYETNLSYQKEKDRIANEQWQKEYNLSLSSRYNRSSLSSGTSSNTNSANGVVSYGELAESYGDGKGNIIYIDTNGNKYTMKEGYNPYTGTKNQDVKYGTWENGYQPKYLNGEKLVFSGYRGTINGHEQNVWKLGNNYYLWNDATNNYYKLSTNDKKIIGIK